MNVATKFQNDERFSVSKRNGLSTVRHDVYFDRVKVLFLQRHLQYWVEGLVHVSIFFLGFVHYAKKWCFRVSDGNVFQYVAVYVHGVYVTIFQRKFAARSRVIVVVCYVCISAKISLNRIDKTVSKSSVNAIFVWPALGVNLMYGSLKMSFGIVECMTLSRSPKRL